MTTLYLDIFSGISGDMFIGAMLDLGLDPHRLEHELERLGVPGYHLHVGRQQKSGIEGVKFDVHLAHGHAHNQAFGHGQNDLHHHDGHDHDHHHGTNVDHGQVHVHDTDVEHGQEHAHALSAEHHHHDDSRDFTEIQALINRSSLSEWVKERSIAVFRRIAVAEGKVHGHPPEEVHFHEVGAIDSIVDIVGACIALEMLGRPRVLAAPVVEGTGWVHCAHGRFPVPTTATLEILGARGIALTQCDEPHELVTPTGAALLAEFVEEFGPMRGLVARKIGYGLGTRNNKTRPNVLRAVLGDETGATAPTGSIHDWETDTVSVLETNLDDISPEILGHFVEQTLASGALDVFYTPVHMKKNRPGVLLTVLCTPSDADRFSESILRETSAFGVRRSSSERRKLKREWTTVSTKFGTVKVKLGKLDGKVLHAAPEYESCRELAASQRVALRDIYEAAQQAIRSQGS